MTHKRPKTVIFQKVRFSSSVYDTFFIGKLHSDIKYWNEIFYEFIKQINKSASLKNGEKQNCFYAEALCAAPWHRSQALAVCLGKSSHTSTVTGVWSVLFQSVHQVPWNWIILQPTIIPGSMHCICEHWRTASFYIIPSKRQSYTKGCRHLRYK